jgi:hypothetical protein
MTFSKEFKDAISNLPDKEKDKLLLRLLKKDVMLVNRLHFELLSDFTVEEQREQIKNKLDVRIERYSSFNYSLDYLNIELRELSGIINEHVYTTKDKYGEVFLTLHLVIKLLNQNSNHILSAKYGQPDKFCIALIAKSFKILLLIKKLHEDYLLDFKNDLNKLGRLIGDNPYMMRKAIYHGLDVNWLLSCEIPDNIEFIYKNIRSKGFLR